MEDESSNEVVVPVSGLFDGEPYEGFFDAKDEDERHLYWEDAMYALDCENRVYLCPGCLNYYEECTCPQYPDKLTTFDLSILPLIRELNRKGYRTVSCCGGHPGECSEEGRMDDMRNVYVSFAEDYAFDPPHPEGARSWHMGPCVEFRPPWGGTAEDYAAHVEKARAALAAWVQALPSRTDDKQGMERGDAAC